MEIRTVQQEYGEYGSRGSKTTYMIKATRKDATIFVELLPVNIPSYPPFKCVDSYRMLVDDTKIYEDPVLFCDDKVVPLIHMNGLIWTTDSVTMCDDIMVIANGVEYALGYI